jgi:hypothetical protein
MRAQETVDSVDAAVINIGALAALQGYVAHAVTSPVIVRSAWANLLCGTRLEQQPKNGKSHRCGQKRLEVKYHWHFTNPVCFHDGAGATTAQLSSGTGGDPRAERGIIAVIAAAWAGASMPCSSTPDMMHGKFTVAAAGAAAWRGQCCWQLVAQQLVKKQQSEPTRICTAERRARPPGGGGAARAVRMLRGA